MPWGFNYDSDNDLLRKRIQEEVTGICKNRAAFIGLIVFTKETNYEKSE